MKTAEEFEGNILNDKGETAIERYLMDRYEFAEAYLKHEVEAISDEDIETHAESVDRLCAHTLGIREGANWFKNKLLKQ